MERVGYFRDAPNDGDLNVTYQLGLCSGLCEEGRPAGRLSDAADQPGLPGKHRRFH